MSIILDENLLKYVLEQEAKNIVGKICKRFEIHTDKEAIKKEVKELLYEHARDLKNQINNIAKKDNKIVITNTDETSKE